MRFHACAPQRGSWLIHLCCFLLSAFSGLLAGDSRTVLLYNIFYEYIGSVLLPVTVSKQISTIFGQGLTIVIHCYRY